MTRRGAALLILLLLALGRSTPGLCAGSPTLVLGQGYRHYLLGPYVDVLEDPAGSLTLDDLDDPMVAGRFRPAGQERLNLGVSSSTWWLRFRLAQEPGHAYSQGRGWLLDMGWPYHHSVKLYSPLPGGGYDVDAGGDPSTLDPGQINHPNFAFPLPRYLAGPMTFYLRVQSRSGLLLPLAITSEAGFIERERLRHMSLGLYYGVMLAMLLLNLLLFLSLRDKSHVWYLLYTFFLTAYFLCYNGFLLKYVFNDQGDQEILLRLLLMGCFIFSAAQFARSFLLTDKNAPGADRVLRAVMGLTLASMALTPALPAGFIIRYYASLALVAPFIAVWCGALCLKRGFRPARYYLVAWTLMAVGGICHGLLFLRVLPLNPVTANIFQTATALEAVVLALALADRVRLLRQERAALAASEERLRSVFDATPFPMVLSRYEDGSVLFANQAACQAVGQSLERLMGQPAADYYADPGDRAEIFAQLRQKGGVQGFEAEMGPPGVWGRTASVSATLMAYRGEQAVLFAAEDITERKRAEEALRKSEERYRLLVENTDEGVVVLQDGSVRFINPRGSEITGYPSALLLGRQALDFVHPEDRPRAADILARVSAGEWSQMGQTLRLFNRSGGIIWISAHAVRIEWEGRSGIIVFMTDVTLRKIMEEDLLEAKVQAEEASRAKSEFLASMSHEIRTPLTAVIGMLDLVRDGENDPVRRDCLDTARDSADHLLYVINDLLDFSKIEAGRLELERVHFDLHEVVRGAVHSLQAQADKKGLQLALDCPPDVPRYVIGDPARLRQVLLNLLGNAMKFTDRGSISVRLEPLDPGRENHVGVRVSVEDTGIGIAPDKATHIFERFTQAEGSISRRYGGTGLGLSISRSIVEMMGGSIGVTSEPGLGSTFFFSLVLEPGDPELGAESRPASPAAPARAPLRLLMVEDNAVNVKVAQMHFNQLGHSVATAWNGQEALVLLTRERFDVVLMDLEMPGMDGIETTRRIRTGRGSSGAILDPLVPVVAMTAHAVAEIRRRCMEAGMDGYVVKPVNFPDLDILLHRLAAGERGQAPFCPLPEADAPPPLLDDVPVLDLKAAMEAMGLDEATFELVLEQSLPEMDRRLDGARKALEEDDLDRLAREAHTLKGTAAAMGARRCSLTALRLHDAARAGEADLCLKYLEVLGAEFQSTLAELALQRAHK